MRAKITKKLLASLTETEKRVVISDTTTPGFQFRFSDCVERGTYSVLYRLADGRRQRYTIGPASVFSPEQARDMAAEFIAKAKRGENPQETKNKSKELTFREFVETEYGPWLKSNRKTGKAMTEVLLKSFPEIENKKMSEVTGWLLEKIRKRYQDNGLKSSSVNRYTTYLRSCLSKAIEWGFLKDHPMKKIKKIREDNSKVRYLSDDERTALMNALDAREERIRTQRDSYNAWARERGYDERPDFRAVPYADYLKPMVLLSLNTGMRQGEVFALDWNEVNIEQKLLTVRAENAKSGKARHIPLNDTILNMLTKWRSQTSSKGLVFPSPRTGGKFDNVKKGWTELLKDAKISSFRWHDMRHDFASKLVMAGADLYVVKELLGHSTIQMTERYAHLAPSAKAAAVRLLDATPPKEHQSN